MKNFSETRLPLLLSFIVSLSLSLPHKHEIGWEDNFSRNQKLVKQIGNPIPLDPNVDRPTHAKSIFIPTHQLTTTPGAVGLTECPPGHRRTQNGGCAKIASDINVEPPKAEDILKHYTSRLRTTTITNKITPKITTATVTNPPTTTKTSTTTETTNTSKTTTTTTSTSESMKTTSTGVDSATTPPYQELFFASTPLAENDSSNYSFAVSLRVSTGSGCMLYFSSIFAMLNYCQY